MDAFSNLRIPSVHMFRRLLKTDLNVLWYQKPSVSIMFMICEMITGSYLCRFNSRGSKSIPSIVMFLYSSTTLCHSISWCMWYCIEWFECTTLAYKNFFHPHSLFLLHSSYLLRYCCCLSASPLSTLCATHFHHHHPLGLVPPMLIC